MQGSQYRHLLPSYIKETPLEYSQFLSEKFGCKVWLKREDQQVVRSYKIRGAFLKMNELSPEERALGVVCASAGNHAQGVAFCCTQMQTKGHIFMPVTTPKQKVEAVKRFGQSWVDIVLIGDTFDDALAAATSFASAHSATIIPPFDDPHVIAGQGTVAEEILAQADFTISQLIVPVGGGGLAAGVASVLSRYSPTTRIVGVEPDGAPSMTEALKQGHPIRLSTIEKFVDGAAVQEVGKLTFDVCKDRLHEMNCVPEGLICQTMLELYNLAGIVVEPAGALTVAALEICDLSALKDKHVVCIISGGNNDFSRMDEIRERAMLYEQRKHYFLIQLPQRPGALKHFVNEVLGPTDDITYFQFNKRNQKEWGPVVIGVELQEASHVHGLVERMQAAHLQPEHLNANTALLNAVL